MQIFIPTIFFLLLVTSIYASLPPRCIGCYFIDCYKNLVSAGTFDSASFNSQMCIDACKNLNEAFAIAFQSACFCLPGSVDFSLFLTSDSDCANPCAANSTDLLQSAFCGGPSLLPGQRYMSLFETANTPRYLGIKVTPSSGLAYDWTQV